MDGIFGIGFAELVIIALVLFIIGGPANTVKWARELGRTLRKARQLWQQTVAELEKDVPGTQEVVDTMVELSQNVREITAAPQRVISGTLGGPVNEEVPAQAKSTAPAATPITQVESSANGKHYPAWLPPDTPPKV